MICGIKLRAEKTLDVLGLSISEAVNMLLHQISLVGGLPFEVRIPSAPESLVISSDKDLYEKLSLSSAQIREGKTIDADAVMERILLS